MREGSGKEGGTGLTKITDNSEDTTERLVVGEDGG
jgi:hypothetical protein